MLSTADRKKFRGALEQVVDLLGVPATWHQTKAPKDTKAVTVGFKSVGRADQELVNAYGIDSKIFTVKATDIPVLTKFDKFTIGTESYTIQDVIPVHLNSVLVFWKGIVKGK